jgi:hypothetical protein
MALVASTLSLSLSLSLSLWQAMAIVESGKVDCLGAQALAVDVLCAMELAANRTTKPQGFADWR